MVPGMTERDRLAVDLRRLEWLADATFGPGQHPRPAQLAVPSGSRYTVPIGLCRRGLALSDTLRHRVRLVRPRAVWALPGETAGQERS